MSGEFSVTQRHGIITLLPKGDKPKQFLKNWRPITLLNITYKLASSCIAERLKNVLPQLIHSDQKGFMKNRYIGENIRLLYDLIFYTELQNKPGMLLLIDFEKAFDSVSHKFIFKMFDFLNFGPSFKKWLKLFYSKCQASVLVNGTASKQFTLGRGCRQGDPLSPYVFLICAEALGYLIRKNNHIKGISVDNFELKITQYADDSTIILDGSNESLLQTLNTLDLFKQLSGLKINEDKTNVIYIGSLRHTRPKRNVTSKKLNWVENGKFSALGVHFSTNLVDMIDLNYQTVMESVEGLMRHWSKRNITVLGRVTIVKSLLIPKFNHLVLSIPNPSIEFLKDLQKKIYEFIWKGKRDKISRDQLSNNCEDGGLRLIKVDLFFEALKSTWIRRIVTGNIDDKENVLFSKITGVNIYDLEKGANHTHSLAEDIQNAFWKDVLLAWAKIKRNHSPETLEDVLKSSIWDNEQFKIGGKEFNFKKWREAGIYFVADIINENDHCFYSHNDLESKYNIRVNPLDYNCVCRAIKGSFRHIFHENTGQLFILKPFVPFHLGLILKEKKGCKRLCTCLTTKKIPKACQKWGLKLGQILSERDWKMRCMIPFKCTFDVKLRWFQYRLLNRILTTNVFMLTIGQRNDNLCTFCNKESETLRHLFSQCERIKPIWVQLQTLISDKVGIHVNLNENHILFGLDPEKSNHAPNTILLLAKFYIYKKRCQNSKPSFLQLKKEMENYHNLERYIYLKDSNIRQYNQKWQVWKSLFA